MHRMDSGFMQPINFIQVNIFLYQNNLILNEEILIQMKEQSVFVPN